MGWWGGRGGSEYPEKTPNNELGGRGDQSTQRKPLTMSSVGGGGGGGDQSTQRKPLTMSSVGGEGGSEYPEKTPNNELQKNATNYSPTFKSKPGLEPGTLTLEVGACWKNRCANHYTTHPQQCPLVSSFVSHHSQLFPHQDAPPKSQGKGKTTSTTSTPPPTPSP